MVFASARHGHRSLFINSPFFFSWYSTRPGESHQTIDIQHNYTAWDCCLSISYSPCPFVYYMQSTLFFSFSHVLPFCQISLDFLHVISNLTRWKEDYTSFVINHFIHDFFSDLCSAAFYFRLRVGRNVWWIQVSNHVAAIWWYFLLSKKDHWHFFSPPSSFIQAFERKKNIFTLQPMEFNIGSSILLEGLILFV